MKKRDGSPSCCAVAQRLCPKDQSPKTNLRLEAKWDQSMATFLAGVAVIGFKETTHQIELMASLDIFSDHEQFDLSQWLVVLDTL